MEQFLQIFLQKQTPNPNEEWTDLINITKPGHPFTIASFLKRVLNLLQRLAFGLRQELGDDVKAERRQNGEEPVRPALSDGLDQKGEGDRDGEGHAPVEDGGEAAGDTWRSELLSTQKPLFDFYRVKQQKGLFSFEVSLLCWFTWYAPAIFGDISSPSKIHPRGPGPILKAMMKTVRQARGSHSRYPSEALYSK